MGAELDLPAEKTGERLIDEVFATLPIKRVEFVFGIPA